MQRSQAAFPKYRLVFGDICAGSRVARPLTCTVLSLSAGFSVACRLAEGNDAWAVRGTGVRGGTSAMWFVRILGTASTAGARSLEMRLPRGVANLYKPFALGQARSFPDFASAENLVDHYADSPVYGGHGPSQRQLLHVLQKALSTYHLPKKRSSTTQHRPVERGQRPTGALEYSHPTTPRSHPARKHGSRHCDGSLPGADAKLCRRRCARCALENRCLTLSWLRRTAPPRPRHRRCTTRACMSVTSTGRSARRSSSSCSHR